MMDQWTCEICGTVKVIPDLARQCEDRHLEQEPLVLDEGGRVSLAP